jgi:hypothetical protein
MVRLKVWMAARGRERRRRIAAFASPVGAPAHVDTKVLAPFERAPLRLARVGLVADGSCGAVAELVERHRPTRIRRRRRRVGAGRRALVAECYELEDECAAKVAVSVGNIVARVPAGADKLSLVSEPARLRLLEEMDFLAVLGVVAQRAIPADPLHVSDLAGAVVVEHAVGVPEVVVAVLAAFLAGDDQTSGASLGVRIPPWSCARIAPFHAWWSSSRRYTRPRSNIGEP